MRPVLQGLTEPVRCHRPVCVQAGSVDNALLLISHRDLGLTEHKAHFSWAALSRLRKAARPPQGLPAYRPPAPRHGHRRVRGRPCCRDAQLLNGAPNGAPQPRDTVTDGLGSGPGIQEAQLCDELC